MGDEQIAGQKTVTLDRMIKSVGKLTEDPQKDLEMYNIAKQGLELISEELDKTASAIKAEVGFDRWYMPQGTQHDQLSKTNVEIDITSSPAIKRPAYKAVVGNMQRHLSGILNLVSTGRTITGVAKEQGLWMIAADRLLEDFYLQVAPQIGVRQTIDAKLTGALSDEPLAESLDLKGRRGYELTAGNLQDYVRMMKLKENLDVFKKEYERVYAKGRSGIKQITEEDALDVEKSTTETSDWYLVVRTLLTLEDKSKGKKRKDESKALDKAKQKEGELNVIADPSISLAEKIKTMPRYDMLYRSVHVSDEEFENLANSGINARLMTVDKRNGLYVVRKVYVSLQSVSDRMQYLIDKDQPLTTKRNRITQLDIV